MSEHRRIIIVEPHATGHHATYLRWVVEAVVEQGWQAVVVTTRHALQHPLLADLRSARSDVEICAVDFPSPAPVWGGLGIVRNEVAHWSAIRRVVGGIVGRGGATAVVLPYLDYCFFACAVLGLPDSRVPWHVISMRLSAVGGDRGRGMPWRWRLARRLLAAPALRTLFVIAPSVRKLPETWLTQPMTQRLQYLPDPAEHRAMVARDAARARLGLADGQLAVLVFGSLDARKGVGRLVDALTTDPSLESYVLVIAGRQAASLRSALAASLAVLADQRRVIELDHVLDDLEQALVFGAADVVWLGYYGHVHMSGVLVLAGQAGLPVVATDEGEVGALVREHSMGELIEPDGDESVRAALLRLTSESKRREYGASARAAVEAHTPVNLKRILVSALKRSA